MSEKPSDILSGPIAAPVGKVFTYEDALEVIAKQCLQLTPIQGLPWRARGWMLSGFVDGKQAVLEEFAFREEPGKYVIVRMVERWQRETSRLPDSHRREA